MWIKKLRIRKLQNVTMIIISCIVVLLISSALGILVTLDAPMSDLQKECNSPQLKFYEGENSKEIESNENKIKQENNTKYLINSLKQLSSVTKTEVIKKATIIQSVRCHDEDIEGFIDLNAYNDYEYLKHIKLIDGRGNDLKNNECIIPKKLASSYNINVNDELEMNYESKINYYKVVGTYSDPYSLNSAFKMNIIVSKIPDTLFTDNVILVYGDESISGQDIIDEYRTSNNNKLDTYAVTIEDCIDNSALGEHITGGILLGIGILILLVSIIMFRFMIKSALINDKMTIAVYKTLGYTYNAIIMMYIKFYGLLIAIGSILGIIGSSYFVNLFLKDTINNIGVENSYYNLLPTLISVLSIFAFIILSLYITLRRLRNISPVNVLRDVSTTSNKRKGTSRLSFSCFNMALRNIICNKRNTVFIFMISFLSIYIINFAIQSLVKVDNMKQDNYYWFGFDKCDVMIDVSSLEDYENIYNEITEDENASHALKSSYRTVNLEWQKGMADTSIDVKLYEDFESASLDVYEGHNPKNNNEIAISYKVSKELNKTIGDYVEIYLNNNEKKSFLVSGIYQTYCEMGKQIRMKCESFNEYNENMAQYDEISVYLKDNSKIQDFVDKYNSKFSDKAKVIDRKDKYNSVMDKICDPQKKSILPFTIITLVLSAINIFGIIMLKNAKDRKSYCIYKSVGHSSLKLIKSNIIYVSILSVISMIVAIPVFFFTYSKVMALCLSGFGIKEYPIDFNLSLFVICNGAIIVLFMIFTILSSLEIYKYKISELNIE